MPRVLGRIGDQLPLDRIGFRRVIRHVARGSPLARFVAGFEPSYEGAGQRVVGVMDTLPPLNNAPKLIGYRYPLPTEVIKMLGYENGRPGWLRANILEEGFGSSLFQVGELARTSPAMR